MRPTAAIFTSSITWRTLVGFLFIFSTIANSGAAYSQTISNLEYIEDSSSRLALDDVINSQAWQISPSKIFNQGYSGSSWWTRFTFSSMRSSGEYVLQIAYAVLDEVDIYISKADGTFMHFKMGDKLTFENRPIEHRMFSVPFKHIKGERNSFYIRVKSTSSIQLPVLIQQTSSFWESEISTSAIHGLYFGGLICLALYNLMVYFALRDATYLYYVAYVLSISLFLACLNGWGFQYLWPKATWWNDQAILVSLNSAVFFGVSFIRRFLSLAEQGGFYDVVSKIAISLSFVGFIFFLLTPYSLGIRVIAPFIGVLCVFGILAGVNAWQKSIPSAGIYIFAWSGILLGGIVLVLSKFQILPRNIFTDYATQLGVLVEVLLLSFALAERINIERSLRLKAQQQALDTQSKAKEQLASAVADRTNELEKANKKLQALSDTDQLTQLKNRRYLDNYIKTEYERAQRYNIGLSILLIDIDFFKRVNDEHGHLAGDECIREVARRLSTEMRGPTDLTARYGGEEFCVVLPQTPLQGAQIVAERIRERVSATSISCAGAHLYVTVSVGVAALTPEIKESCETLLKRADDNLYLAKSNGRNRVEI